ncbi:hypothetical protein FB45DRAFT_446911 [Roridomyces roridus]|uniref:EF-hand domain-containing protein n=1 Tax=Roridomyces roridus TaxID=1738132 RepID=A0AAD7C186_9AGAR|nr:hypothetical protein FB45DRAFT_446911 [Roridomyces roridus]
MDVKIDRAEKALQDARALIQNIAGGSSKKQNKAHVRKILGALQQTMSVLGGAGEYDPRAKAAVSIFMSVLQLEINRRDNDESIVAVCYSMTSMIFVLRYLNEDVAQREDLADQLAEHMENMSLAIKDFGAFADVYYTKCKSWIVRFARATEFKTKIQDFAQTFKEHQDRIEFILVVQMAGGQVQIARDVAAVQSSIGTLIDRVGEPMSDRERQALQYISAHGQQILETSQGLSEVGKKLHDSVTSSTMEAINDAFDELLEQNSTLFEFKLKGATMELGEAINRSTSTILQRMDSGPHDLIDEPDIKAIWKGNEWKFSVKCRIFVDALCNFYTEKFIKTSGDDGWTLKILSKVINYPAVGEAIDEDASGFISVHEMNQFLKKNVELPTPVWFALWAVGPQYLDSDYTAKINEITTDLNKRCAKLKTAATSANEEDLVSCLDGYLDSLKLIGCITDWAEWDAGASGLEELDDETETELVEVATKFAAKKEGVIQGNLETVAYRVDRSSLPSLTEEPAFRIEQSISVLLYLVLKKHQEIIVAGMDSATAAAKWQEMDDSLDSLIWEFHERFKSLRRSWRSQKLDIELQVECYAGGLFNGWYEEYDKDDNLISNLLEDDEDEDEDDEEGEGEENEDKDKNKDADADKGNNVDSVDAKVEQLSTRVTAIDARLDKIESMLEQLLSMGQGGGTTSAARKPGVRDYVQKESQMTTESEGEGEEAPESGGEGEAGESGEESE